MNSLEIQNTSPEDRQNQGLLMLRSREDDWLVYSTRRETSTKPYQLLAVAAFGLLSLLLSIAALSMAATAKSRVTTALASDSSGRVIHGGGPASLPDMTKVAFGSCTSYDLRPQPIWTKGVIPAQPDAWVWVGDMSYMDDPIINCAAVPHFQECNCTPTWLRRPPDQCYAGDPVHAQARMNHQLSIQEYRAFLSFMCPRYEDTGVFPPRGTDPAMCSRPIFGTYDDHDFGWNNGNARNPAKHAIKNIYLDGLGEDAASPRRSSATGLQAHYTLRHNIISSSMAKSTEGLDKSSRSGADGGGGGGGGSHDKEIEMILLDERYFRETFACSQRRDWCAEVNNKSAPGTADAVWCHDFLVEGGIGPGGSCCSKDDEWEEWCRKAGPESPHWDHLCRPSSSHFATEQLILSDDNITVLPHTPDLWQYKEASLLWRRLIEGSSSPICEVLGPEQRQWLRELLTLSPAPLKLIASGSVVAGTLGHVTPQFNVPCSGDDWMCWPRAQVNLLHTVGNTSHGCAVIMTGDYHYSDIRVFMPGGGQKYAAELETGRLQKPVYQIMSSGLTWSTAKPYYATCKDTFREDKVGLRPLGPCSYVHEPSFGMASVDWKAERVSLTIRNGTTGEVAYGLDGKRQEVVFSLEDCRPV